MLAPTFTKPGYYKIEARARNRPRPTSPLSDSGIPIAEETFATLWLLITEDGGRSMAEFDSTAIGKEYVPRDGSMGPFLRRRNREDLAVFRSKAREAPQKSLVTGGAFVYGTLRYRDRDSVSTFYSPVDAAKVNANCYGKSSAEVDGYDLTQQIVSFTGTDGYFSIACPANYEYVEASFVLSNSLVSATSGTAYVAGFDGSAFSPIISDEYAARAFINLTQWIPQLHSKFGRSRGAVSLVASPSLTSVWCASAGPGCPIGNAIVMQHSRTFNRVGSTAEYDGLFVAVHEYAHAFHWAVEPPGQWTCTNGDHFFTETENLGCAFAEGFADFAALWTLGGVLGSTPESGDYGIENNLYASQPTNPPSGGDGMRVEAAVAAFLYDLVDGSSETDGPYNQIGAPEAWDTVSVPAGWLLDVIKYCRPGGTQAQLSGPDELVYCLEKSTSAYAVGQTHSPFWRLYSSVWFDQPVATYSATDIRTLWLKNYYGIYP